MGPDQEKLEITGRSPAGQEQRRLCPTSVDQHHQDQAHGAMLPPMNWPEGLCGPELSAFICSVSLEGQATLLL